MRNIERLVPGVACAAAILLFGLGQTGTEVHAQAGMQAPAVDQATGAEGSKPKVDISAAKPQAEKPKPEGEGGEAAPVPARPPGRLTKEDVKSFEPVEGEVIDPLVMVVEPAILDLGEIPTGDTGVGKIKLTNGGEVDRVVRDCKTSCGCTTANCKKGQTLKPGESMEVEIKLDGGTTERALNKTVTFMVSGQPQIRVPIKAQAIAFVTIEPAVIDPEKNLDGKLTLKSRDNTPFRITSMHPPVITDFGDESKTVHEVVIDWNNWNAQEQKQRKMLFNLDHPKCSKVYATVAMVTAPPPPGPIAGKDRGGASAAEFAQLVKTGQIDKAIEVIASGKVPANGTDNSGRTTLGIAAESGDVRLIQAVLDASADIEATDRTGRTPLMYAVQSKKVEAIKAVIEAGANVNAQDQIGSTALCWAASPLGHPDAVKTLISAGADVNSVGPEPGFTPLIWAAGFGDTESAKLLIEAGAKLEAVSFEKATPLMYAVRTNRPDNVTALLEHGANLEARDAEGKTPLLMACSNSGPDVEMIKLLIARGADVSARSASGLSALDLALKRTDPRSEEVATYLRTVAGIPATEETDGAPTAAKAAKTESSAGGHESATPHAPE